MSATGKYLIVIAGPTAAGKTALAIRLARHFRTDIISADARQFYREMEIGTAKPDQNDLEEIKHHFINNKSITELYGAGDYEKEVMELLPGLFAKKDVLILVGGSGLYIDAVLKGVDDFDKVPGEVREKINKEFEQGGTGHLRKELQKLDPAYFEKVDQNNPQRMIRALEVIRHTGRTFSSFLSGRKATREFIPIKILVYPDREILYKQIEKRADDMIARGLVAEVVSLRPLRHLNALKTVGYTEIFEYLDGSYDLNRAIDLIKQHTRNYAKRQLTWFRNRGNYQRFGPGDDTAIIRYTEEQMRQK